MGSWRRVFFLCREDGSYDKILSPNLALAGTISVFLTLINGKKVDVKRHPDNLSCVRGVIRVEAMLKIYCL